MQGAHHQLLAVGVGGRWVEGEIVQGVPWESHQQEVAFQEAGPCQGVEPYQVASAWEWGHREAAFLWAASLPVVASSLHLHTRRVELIER